jgi:hypothetical protein
MGRKHKNTADNTIIDLTPDAFGLVSEPAIAVMLRRDSRTLQRWHAERRGPPFVLVGNERRYSVDTVQRWLFSREEHRKPEPRRRAGGGR